MTHLSVICTLWGAHFSPKPLEASTVLRLENTYESGAIGSNSMPLAYGSASIQHDFSEKDFKKGFNPLDPMLTLLEQHQAALQAAGVTKISLGVTFGYQAQCNWEVRRAELKRIVALGIAALRISAYRLP